MKRKNYPASMFMILLVMLIPVCVSDAYAANVDIIEIKGTGDVNGYVEPNDVLTMTALAQIDDTEDVTYRKLKVFHDSSAEYANFDVDGCERLSEGSPVFKCTFTDKVFGAVGTHTFTVELYKAATVNIDTASPEASETMAYTVDDIGAKVTSVTAVPARTKGGNIQIQYSAEDYIEAEGVIPGDCSGVDIIEFYQGDYSGSLVKVEETYHLCDLTGSFAYDAGTNEGDFQICAKAYDQLGQSIAQTICGSYSVDRTGPQPDIGSLIMVYSSGETLGGVDVSGLPVEYVGGQVGAKADITIGFNAADLVNNTVKADFSSIGGGSSEYPSQGDISSPDGANYLITWRDVGISSSISSCTFDIYAGDSLGNSATTTVPCSISVDQQGPSIQQILTPHINTNTGLYYLGMNPTNITAIITEPGVGLNTQQIYMHLDEFGSGAGMGARVQPDNCSRQSGDTWVCEWWGKIADASVDDGVYNIQISGESADDLGNIIGAAYQQEIGLDRTPPSVPTDVDVLLVPGINNVPTATNVVLTGDRLIFTICTDDPYHLSANFSGLGGGQNVLPTSCDTTTDPACCDFEVTVAGSGPYAADIEFMFLDSSGNINTLTKTVDVSGTFGELNPDFWDHTVICSPNIVDREIASLMPMPVYCFIELADRQHPDAAPLSFSMEDFPADCYAPAEGVDVTDYISDIQVGNAGTRDPYLFIELQETGFTMDSIQFKCDLEIFTKEGNSYTINAEKEIVDISLAFFDLPAGTPEEGYADSLDDVDSMLGWMEGLFDGVYAAYEIAKGICDLYAAYNTAMGALSIITSGTSKAALAAGWKSNPTGNAFVRAWKVQCKKDKEGKSKGWQWKNDKVEWMCHWVNCDYSSDILNLSGIFNASSSKTNTTAGYGVEESFFLSLFTGCIPGVLYNLNKWRQIYCQYGVCILEQVPLGVPVESCKAMKGYLECKFWVGEVLSLFPWVNIQTHVMEALQKILSDPLSAVLYLLEKKLSCDLTCRDAGETLLDANVNGWCVFAGWVDQLGDAVGEITRMMDPSFWELGDEADFCEDYYEIVEGND